VWVVDSIPVECARSRETVHRLAPAGWAEYGYCASHSRYFWGLRLHLLCTLHGLPARDARWSIACRWSVAIDNDEGSNLLRIVRRGSGSVVTWRRASDTHH
jgi:hypothetical protein